MQSGRNKQQITVDVGCGLLKKRAFKPVLRLRGKGEKGRDLQSAGAIKGDGGIKPYQTPFCRRGVLGRTLHYPKKRDGRESPNLAYWGVMAEGPCGEEKIGRHRTSLGQTPFFLKPDRKEGGHREKEKEGADSRQRNTHVYLGERLKLV